MPEQPHSSVPVRARLGAIELEERQALAAYRHRQARGVPAGVPHEEAFRRVFADDKSIPGR